MQTLVFGILGVLGVVVAAILAWMQLRRMANLGRRDVEAQRSRTRDQSKHYGTEPRYDFLTINRLICPELVPSRTSSALFVL
jgi:hypothetical protein